MESFFTQALVPYGLYTHVQSIPSLILFLVFLLRVMSNVAVASQSLVILVIDEVAG